MSFTILRSLLLFCTALYAIASPHLNEDSRRDNSTGSTTEVEMVASAYYTAGNFTLDEVSWDKYTHLYYAFATTIDDPSNVTLTDDDAHVLGQFVTKAHENDVKALLSIGGWTGSRFFSTNVGDEQNRTQFVNTVTDLINQYGLDGVDFDWEYPNRQGIGCNAISSNDTANFLAFLQQLRNSTNSSTLITAPVSITTFNDANGTPSMDVSGFAEVFDWITIMVYDIWGSWSSAVGPNAPLNDTCAPKADQQGSAVSAVASWTAAGMPVSKIVLGVPSYGHSFYVDSVNAFNGTELAAYPPFNASAPAHGDQFASPAGVDECGVLEAAGDTWIFWSLVNNGLLLDNGTAAPGIPHRFDDCSKTDYVYNTTSSIMISYDSPETYTAKGEFITNMGLRGFSMWQLSDDWNDVLLDSILAATGQDDGNNRC